MNGDREEQIARAVALKAAVEYYKTIPYQSDNTDNKVVKTAEKFLNWLKGSDKDG